MNVKDRMIMDEFRRQRDTTTAPALEAAMASEMEIVKDLVPDLEQVAYISPAGLRVLLGGQKKMAQIGTRKLVNVCDMVMEVFEMTGFADILTIE